MDGTLRITKEVEQGELSVTLVTLERLQDSLGRKAFMDKKGKGWCIKRNVLSFPCPVQEWLAQSFQPVRCPLCFFDGFSIQYFLNQGFGFFACRILPVPFKRWSK